MFPQQSRWHEKISIHALREEGDPLLMSSSSIVFIFLSTPSARRATDYYYPQFANIGISIHALREEGDSKNREKIPAFIPL